MSLKNMTLKDTSPTISVTGGADVLFAEDGVQVQNGVHLMVPADTDFMTRRQATFKNRSPVYDPKTGRTTKAKRTASYVVPRVYNGETVYNTVRCEVEVHPSMTDSEITQMLQVGAQMFIDTDTGSFFLRGSLA